MSCSSNPQKGGGKSINFLKALFKINSEINVSKLIHNSIRQFVVIIDGMQWSTLKMKLLPTLKMRLDLECSYPIPNISPPARIPDNNVIIET